MTIYKIKNSNLKKRVYNIFRLILKMFMDITKLKTYIISQLEEMKVENIISIDTSKISSIADLIIIGDGRSGKHIESTMELLKINLKKEYEIEGMINGTANDGWIILDLGNIIVHLFIPAVRDIYKLEELFYTKK